MKKFFSKIKSAIMVFAIALILGITLAVPATTKADAVEWKDAANKLPLGGSAEDYTYQGFLERYPSWAPSDIRTSHYYKLKVPTTMNITLKTYVSGKYDEQLMHENRLNVFVRNAKGVIIKGKQSNNWKYDEEFNITYDKWTKKLEAGTYYIEVKEESISNLFEYFWIDNTYSLPMKPESITATSSNGKVTLKWTKAPGVSGYSLFRAGKKNGNYKRIRSLGGDGTLTYTTKNKLKVGKTYYFKVRGYLNIGKKTYTTKFSPVVAVTIK